MGESRAIFCSGSFIYSKIKYKGKEVRACVDDCCPAETQHACWVAVTLFLSDTCHYSFHFCHFKRHSLQSPLGPLRVASGNSRFCGRWMLGTPRVLPLAFLTCVSVAHALEYETLQRYRRRKATLQTPMEPSPRQSTASWNLMGRGFGVAP